MSQRRRLWLSAGALILLVAAVTGGVTWVVQRSQRTDREPPPPPRAGVEAITIPSVALGRDMPALVWLPEPLETGHTYPLVVLFHGQGGDVGAWFHGIGVDVIARDLIAQGLIPPVILVSAGIDDSMGIDSAPSEDGYDHGAYGTWTADELVPALAARYPVSTDPRDRFLAGLSMGGYAALHAVFRHPDRFRGVGALSPAITLDTHPERAWMYPDEATRDSLDPLRLAATAPLTGLRVFVGYGTPDYDWIIEGSQELE
ncbi:MAG: esterase family protein, partial [Chloroflexi bacterium]|nr:esterase family protein [Chloroflexota bacterium]